ncbi:MAG: hypothetical protein WA705_19345 [Candidatus Ozemobacteraceae bacterium]
MSRIRVVATIIFFAIMGMAIQTGCGSSDSTSSNPAGTFASGTSLPTTNVVFRLLPPLLPIVASREASPEPLGTIFATGVIPPIVDFSLRLVNSGIATNPVTMMRKTVTATATGTGYTAVTTFSGIPLQTAIGEVTISGGTLNGFSQYRGAMDLVDSPLSVLELAASGTRELPDLKAQVLEQLIATSTDFVKFTGLLVSLIDSAFSKQGITSGASYEKAYTAFVGNIVSQTTTTIALSATVTKVSLAALKILIKNVPTTFVATTTVEVGGVAYTIEKDPDATQLFGIVTLFYNGAVFGTVADFNTLTFTTGIPSKGIVEVYSNKVLKASATVP